MERYGARNYFSDFVLPGHPARVPLLEDRDARRSGQWLIGPQDLGQIIDLRSYRALSIAEINRADTSLSLGRAEFGAS